MLSKRLVICSLTFAYRVPAKLFNDTGSPEVVIDLDLPNYWTEAASQGRQYWTAWKQKTGSDVQPPGPWPRTINYRYDEDPARLTPDSKAALAQSAKSTDDDDYVTVEVYWPKGFNDDEDDVCEQTYFHCIASASQDVLIAGLTDGAEDMASALELSQIAWRMWAIAVQKSTPNGSQHDYAKLKVFMGQCVDNSTTSAILKLAMQSIAAQPGSAWKFTPSSGDEHNPFWPLLASSNGVTAIEMLTEHKATMNGKSITSMEVCWAPQPPEGGGPDFVLWANIG